LRTVNRALRQLRLGAALTGALFFFFLWARAEAHPEFNPAVVNRYAKLSLVSADQVRLAYSVMFGAAPALAERKRADTNGDGRLDEEETKALSARLRGELTAQLRIMGDGTPIQPVFEDAAVGLAGAEVGPSPFSIDLLARLPLAPRADHTVTFDDPTSLPLLGETEVRIEEGPRTKLLAAYRGSPSDSFERESRFLFRGPKFSALEDRSITFRFAGTGPTASAPKRPRWRWPLGPGIVTVALLAAVWVFRRQRKMNG
jgi:hypothetical protein